MAATLDHVTIVEVGPRDGLQNEPQPISTTVKIDFVNALSAAGLPVIEATSFVNPKAVPRMADAFEVMAGISRRPGVRYPVLIPNSQGYDRAVEAGVDAIALFTSATEAFCQANVRCSIDESFARFDPVVTRAREAGQWIRGYVSVAFDCPYSGKVPVSDAVAVTARLFAIGCDEVSIADTIGTADRAGVEAMLTGVAEAGLPRDRVALHFHDTYGQAVANVERAYELGIRIFDSAAGGLGGCPFAPGAPGNVATESLLRRFQELGVPTGVDLAGVEAAFEIVRAEGAGGARMP